jgi:class 3 adenylate cyclase
MHSGPVTGGVLRGERARFQLFGDTMNTAARMEQTSMKDKIQMSQATADCLVAGGKWYVFCVEMIAFEIVRIICLTYCSPQQYFQ